MSGTKTPKVDRPLLRPVVVFITVLLAPVWFLPYMGHRVITRGRRRKERDEASQLTLSSVGPVFHTSYFIGVGYFLALLISSCDCDPEIMTWLWLAVGLVTAVVVLMDLGRNGIIALILCAVVFVLLSGFAKQRLDIPLLGIIGRTINDIDAMATPGLMVLVSTGLLFLQALMWVRVAFDGRWNVVAGRISHMKSGSSTETYTRDNVRLTFEYPDWLQWVLFRTGSIVLTPTTSGVQPIRIENVVGLPALENKLVSLFNQVSVGQSSKHD